MWYEFSEDNTKVLIKHPKTIGHRWIRNEVVPQMLIHPNENKNLTLIKIDENVTKHYKTDICPTCNGVGKVYLGTSDNNEYICNKCDGNGKLKRAKTYKIYSYEYGKTLEKEYMKKQHEKFFEENGINEDGSTYVYIGNTYPIKSELNSKGVKFDSTLSKWHSRELLEGYDYIKVTVPLKIYSDGSLGYDFGYAEGENHFSDSTKLNNLLDDVRKEIRTAENELGKRL